MLDFLLPTGCVVCRSWIPAEEGRGAADIVCRRCTIRLAPASWPRCPRCHAPRGTGREAASGCLECRDWPPALSRARYAWILAPPATELVHALKYEGWRELAEPMGVAMARELGRDRLPGGVVVPVPTTPARARRRGYNQAGLLAGVVARRLGLPYHEGLRRSSAPSSQTSLSPRARKENVRGAFAVVDGAGIEGTEVVLVDDVLTTGATAAEAASTLASAGAASVSLVTFARALPRVQAPRSR